MDFSNNVFNPSHSNSNSTLSDDAMSHTQMVMACRWGWTSASPNTSGAQTPPTLPPSVPTSSNTLRAKRFAPCQGRLYHQLLCSHRIRTDLVEDCGTNCVEPLGNATATAFICNECIQSEAAKIWEARKAEHDASYPAMDQMTNEQYNQWYQERSQLEAEFTRDRKLYELELQATMRPTNICCALEATKDEMEFAAELDSLSLQMMASTDTSKQQHNPAQLHSRGRVSLPSDTSEQLHWGLNSLALDRGSCGVEYSASQPGTHMSPSVMDKDVLWRKARD